MEYLTKGYLSILLSCPSQLIDSYESQGMPVVFIGDLKRYEKKKVFNWLKKYYNKLYSQIENNYYYEVQ